MNQISEESSRGNKNTFNTKLIILVVIGCAVLAAVVDYMKNAGGNTASQLSEAGGSPVPFVVAAVVLLFLLFTKSGRRIFSSFFCHFSKSMKTTAKEAAKEMGKVKWG